MSELLHVHEVLQTSPSYRLSWYNPQKTIIVLEITGPWTWDEAFRVIPLLNRMVEAQPHPVYSLYYYRVVSASLLPKGAGLTNLRKLVEFDPPNEKLVIFIRQDTLTRNFMSLVSRVYGLRQVLQKYRFVASWEEALRQVAADQAEA
jgi:hypothetical protein